MIQLVTGLAQFVAVGKAKFFTVGDGEYFVPENNPELK